MTREEADAVKNIDDDMLWYDLTEQLNEILPGGVPAVHVEIDYTVRPFKEVEKEYMALFRQYSEIGISE